MQVHKVVFNMVTYGGETKKPTMLLTNSPGLCSMSNSSDKRKTDAAKKRLCRKYWDKQGRPRFHGTAALKQSQTFSWKKCFTPLSSLGTSHLYQVSSQTFCPGFFRPNLPELWCDDSHLWEDFPHLCLRCAIFFYSHGPQLNSWVLGQTRCPDWRNKMLDYLHVWFQNQGSCCHGRWTVAHTSCRMFCAMQDGPPGQRLWRGVASVICGAHMFIMCQKTGMI